MSPILRPYQLHKGVTVNQKSDVKDELPVKDKDVVIPVAELTNEEKISHALQEILNRKIDKAIVSAESALGAPLAPLAVPPVQTTQEIIKTPGQEIAVPIIVGNISPASEIGKVPQVTPPIVEVTQQQIPQTVVSEQQVQVQAQPTVVTTVPVQSAQQVVPIPPSQATTLNMGPAPAKVHWFDKLFGSAPKTPPQST